MKRLIGMCVALCCSGTVLAASESEMSTCTAFADVASLAVEAKNAGISFNQFGEILASTAEAPPNAVNIMKSIAAVAYEEFDSPEKAYAGLMRKCLASSNT